MSIADEGPTYFLISHIEVSVLRATIRDLEAQLAAARSEDNAEEVTLLLERNVDLMARNAALTRKLTAIRRVVSEWFWEGG